MIQRKQLYFLCAAVVLFLTCFFLVSMRSQAAEKKEEVTAWVDALRREENYVARAFVTEWDRFMELFGRRCHGELDVGAPRF